MEMSQHGADADGSASIRVSLLLRGFDISVDEVTRQLGVTPTNAGSKGEAVVTTTGHATARVHGHSFWSLRSGLPPNTSLER